jgi:hypothetical protein
VVVKWQKTEVLPKWFDNCAIDDQGAPSGLLSSLVDWKAIGKHTRGHVLQFDK